MAKLSNLDCRDKLFNRTPRDGCVKCNFHPEGDPCETCNGHKGEFENCLFPTYGLLHSNCRQ